MALRKPRGSTAILCLCSCWTLLSGGRVNAVPFIRGDVDANGSPEMADAVRIFGFLFLGSPRILTCKDAADANDSGAVDLSDGIQILAHLFIGASAPPAPFPDCGRDPTDDALDCRIHAFCPVPFCERTAAQFTSIDVSGHMLRFQSQGTGCPGIILDAGLGDSGLVSFSGILPQLAAISRVLVYDRAGLGASQLGPEPRTPLQLVTELHTLLEKVDFEPPYVIVGHSWSGYNIRVFADMYPGEVAGMVFVDASHEYFWSQWAALYPVEFDLWKMDDDKYLAGFSRGVQLEYEGSKEARFVNPGPIPDVPIVVLTATKHGFTPEVEQLVVDAHESLARSVTNGTHIVLPGVGHYIHQERQQVVIDAIRQIVEAAR